MKKDPAKTGITIGDLGRFLEYTEDELKIEGKLHLAALVRAIRDAIKEKSVLTEPPNFGR